MTQLEDKEIIEEFIYDNWSYKIRTNKQVIFMGFVGDGGGCCSVQGFMTTEDTLKDFIGAELLDINLIDMDYTAHPLSKNYKEGEGVKFCFIDIITNKGKLQFAIYNDHNGYYGYDIEINSTQLTHKDTL